MNKNHLSKLWLSKRLDGGGRFLEEWVDIKPFSSSVFSHSLSLSLSIVASICHLFFTDPKKCWSESGTSQSSPLTHPRKILTLTDFINRKAITYFFLFYHHSPYFLVVSVRQRDLVFDIPLGKIGGIWLGGWGLFSFYLRFLNLGNLFQSSFITSILFVIKIYEWETMKTLAC